jgi:Cys-tRNA(Pro)/Cys-tRNA(Cys) deacylase
VAKAKQSAGTPAIAALSRADVTYTVHPYTHDPASTAFGDEVIRELGLPAERVFKTLVVDVDGQLAVAVVPVAGQLDLKAFAAARGGKRAALAAQADAERATGYVVGGISPLGQRKRLPTVVDESALGFETVFCSAGRRGLQIEVRPDDLVRLTGAVTGAIGR